MPNAGRHPEQTEETQPRLTTLYEYPTPWKAAISSGKEERSVRFIYAQAWALAIRPGNRTVFYAGLRVSRAQQGAKAHPGAAAAFTVDGGVAFASLLALSDGRLQKTIDSLLLPATSEAARSGDWEKIRGPLSEAGKANIPALNWFALPDASYWSVQQGRATGNLANLPYFPSVLAGGMHSGLSRVIDS